MAYLPNLDIIIDCNNISQFTQEISAIFFIINFYEDDSSKYWLNVSQAINYNLDLIDPNLLVNCS